MKKEGSTKRDVKFWGEKLKSFGDCKIFQSGEKNGCSECFWTYIGRLRKEFLTLLGMSLKIDYHKIAEIKI